MQEIHWTIAFGFFLVGLNLGVALGESSGRKKGELYGRLKERFDLDDHSKKASHR